VKTVADSTNIDDDLGNWHIEKLYA